MLQVTDLQVHYGAVHALQGLSLEVRQGEIVTLIGSNGAGKSTTLRAISGMLKPSGGSIVFDKRPIGGCAPHVIVGMGIAHAPEGRGIFANLTVEENLRIGAFVRSDKDGIRADTDKVFGLFPRLLERRIQLAGTLSGGEQQMLAIGRAVMARPAMLLLDEPSLGIAPRLVADIFEAVARIAETGTTILLVEQNTRLALKYSTRAYVLRTGEIAMSGPSSELASNAEIKAAYLGG